MMMRVGDSLSVTVARPLCWKKWALGHVKSRAYHTTWLPQLPLHFSANLQRNKTYVVSDQDL